MVHRKLDFLLRHNRHYINAMEMDATKLTGLGENDNCLLDLATVPRNIPNEDQKGENDSGDEVIGPDQGDPD